MEWAFLHAGPRSSYGRKADRLLVTVDWRCLREVLDGDQAKLEYTTIDNPLPSFGLIHHTDADRDMPTDTFLKAVAT